jgi:hypothetical protein
MDETAFQVKMLKEMLEFLGWTFIEAGQTWTAVLGTVPLSYYGEYHNVVIRAATMTAGANVRSLEGKDFRI